MTYKLETVCCPLCDSKEYNIFLSDAKELYIGTKELFSVVRCKKCRHYFTNPRPTKETIKYFYPDTSGYYIPSEESHSRSNFRQKIFYYFLYKYRNYPTGKKSIIFDIFCSFIFLFFSRRFDLMHIPQYVDRGRLLDIGCSWGGYLSQIKSFGWDVYGTEINKKAASYAMHKIGADKIQNVFFEDSIYEDNFFDAVNISMVLEHTYNPAFFLEKLNRITKSSAQIMISVPNISGFEMRLYKTRCYALQVPQHLQHFNEYSLKELLYHKGFKIEKIVFHNNDRDLVASSNYISQKWIKYFLHNGLIRRSFIKSFVMLLSVLGFTSRMTFYVRKK